MFSQFFGKNIKETQKIDIEDYLPIYKAILGNNVNSLDNIKNIINQIPYERVSEGYSYHDNLYPPALIYAIWLCNNDKISKDEQPILNNINNTYKSETVQSPSREQLKQIIFHLIQKGADPNLKYNKTALMYAVEYNDDDMINFLLDNGAKIDATNKYGLTTLMYAILHDKIDQVKLLISKGADVTKKSSEDQTTLMYAIQSSNIDIVELLLNKITDKTQRIEFINQVGTYYSALMYAVTYNDFNMVRLLLENGANPNIISKYGNTALNSAIMFSNQKYYHYNKEKYDDIATHEMTNQIVTLLLNYGANPNLKDNDRKTALIHAVEYPTKYTNPAYYYKEDPGNAYSKIVQVLLNYGANPNIRDNAGKTALDYAKSNGNILKLLQIIKKGGSAKSIRLKTKKTATKSRRLKTKKTVKKYRKKPQN
jgi:ankyrin repeat protein